MFLPRPVQCEFVSACECNSRCIEVLSARRRHHCLFTDIHDFSGVGSSFWIPGVDWQVCLEGLVADWKPRTAWCVNHLQRCPMPDVDGDMTGTQCQPFSRAGKNLGMADARCSVLLVYLAWLLVVRPLFFIHENVRGFPIAVLEEALGRCYRLIHLLVDPSDFAFNFVSRPRLYTIGIRLPAEFLIDVPKAYLAMKARCQQMLRPTTIVDCLVGTAADILAFENAWRSNRQLEPLRKASCDWSYMLTPKQAEATIEIMFVIFLPTFLGEPHEGL